MILSKSCLEFSVTFSNSMIYLPTYYTFHWADVILLTNRGVIRDVFVEYKL